MASDPASTVQPEHRAGDVIAGRYRLKTKLGEGGMGVVWVAHSTALDVDVALKMLKRELAGTPAVERMAREARTAAQLGHPALVRVFDFGMSELGAPFIAMELLEGEELHTRLARESRIAATTAVAIMLPIIDGLGTAHDKGVVHRDIKPENIFIATDGQGRVQPKVLDFGIAKLGHDDSPSRLTQVGAVMGSPYYLSPEQAEGLDDIDFRCDIWALGVVMYELVSGAPPFSAANYNALIRSILRDNPTPITEHASGDAELWVIIERCLRKDREQRWGSMWELGEALALWLFERGVRVDISSRSLRHGWLDGGITGLQILVTSEPPDAATLAPPALLALPMPVIDVGLPRAAASADRDAFVKTQERPRKPRSLVPTVLVALVLMLAAAAGVALTLRRAPVAAERQAMPPAQPAARPTEEPVPVAVPSLVVAPALPATEPAPAEPAPAVAASASAAPAQAQAPAAPSAQPPRAKSPRPARPKTSSPRGANTEFGF